jgi:hypothetical protein
LIQITLILLLLVALSDHLVHCVVFEHLLLLLLLLTAAASLFLRRKRREGAEVFLDRKGWRRRRVQVLGVYVFVDLHTPCTVGRGDVCRYWMYTYL